MDYPPLSEEILLEQGCCCGSCCQNCPYEPKHQKGTVTVKRTKVLSKRDQH